MADEIDILLGGGMNPQNTDTAAMAAALRGQLNEGSALGMSTIGGVADFGKSQSRAARAGATKTGNLKKALEKEARAQKEVTDKEARMLKKAIAKETRAQKEQIEDEKRRGLLAADVAIQSQTDKKDYWQYQVDNPKASKNAYTGRATGTMSKPDIKKFEAMASDGMASAEAIGGYANAFSQPEFLGMSMEGMPFINSMENFVAANIPAMSNDAEKAKQKWWSDFNMFHTLPERHKLFGSALTETELKSWNAANITESMTADQVKERLDLLQGLHRKAMRKAAGNAKFEGASDEYIKFNVGDLNMDDVNYDTKFQSEPKQEATGGWSIKKVN